MLGPLPWPPMSPDLIPLDFYFWVMSRTTWNKKNDHSGRAESQNHRGTEMCHSGLSLVGTEVLCSHE
jgi:hypothetical protein